MDKFYRYVNGELTEILERDWSRRQNVATGEVIPKRYSAVSRLGHIEFTEEEEQDRDHEEIENIKKDKIRQREIDERKMQFEKKCNSLAYEERLLVLIDVLGWRNTVQSSSYDPNLMKKLGRCLLSLEPIREHIDWLDQHQVSPSKDNVAIFSDHIVVSILPHYEKKLSANSLDFLCAHYIKNIIRNFVDLGLLVRGAITFGKLFHAGNIIFGPALNRVVDLEKKANSPRIILDEILADALKIDGDKVTGVCIQHSEDPSDITLRKTFLRDEDGQIFYNWLTPFFDGSLPIDEHQIRILRYELLSVKNVITKELRKAHSEKIQSKIEWVKSYYQKKLQEYGLQDDEELKL